MPTLAVREHFNRFRLESVSLRGCDAGVETPASPTSISVRELVDRNRGYQLKFGCINFNKSFFWDPKQAQPNKTIEIPFIPESFRIRLEVWIDGEYSHFLRFNVSKQGTYALPWDAPAMKFRNSLVLRFFEEALFLPDQARPALPVEAFIREHSFESPTSGAGQHKFVLPTGLYTLDYEVDRVAGVPMSAKEMVQEFRDGLGDGVWPTVSREKVADDMDERVADPSLIDQGPTPLCGPSSVIHALAKKSPRRYVKMITQLFEQGTCETKYGQVRTTSSLRGSKVPSYANGVLMSPADWIPAAAMRNAANHFYRVESDKKLERDVAGITAVWAIQTWLRNLLGYEGIGVHKSTILGKWGFNFGAVGNVLGLFGLVDFLTNSSPRGSLEAGRRAIRQGGVCLMMVNSEGLIEGLNEVVIRPNAPKKIPRDPSKEYVVEIRSTAPAAPTWATHWIVLWESWAGARITISDKTVKFGFFSWGDYHNLSVPYATFERNTFLVVAATQI